MGMSSADCRKLSVVFSLCANGIHGGWKKAKKKKKMEAG